MPARCHNDSCSVKWSEVNTASGPAYQADVAIDADSSIFCDAATGGLNVKAGGGILSKNADGTIVANMPRGRLVSLPAQNFAAVPQSADDQAPAAAGMDFSYTNDSGGPQTLIVKGQFNLHYDVMREGNPTPATATLQRSGNFTTSAPVKSIIPYNAQMIARLKRSLSGAQAVAMTPVVAQHYDLSGVVVDPGDRNEYKSEWRDFVHLEQIANGTTIRFTADIFFDGPQQTLNVGMSPAETGSPNRGFRVHNLDIVALPIGLN